MGALATGNVVAAPDTGSIRVALWARVLATQILPSPDVIEPEPAPVWTIAPIWLPVRSSSRYTPPSESTVTQTYPAAASMSESHGWSRADHSVRLLCGSIFT